MIFGCQEKLSSVSTTHLNLRFVVFFDFHRLDTRLHPAPNPSGFPRASMVSPRWSTLSGMMVDFWGFGESGWLITKRIDLRFGDYYSTLFFETHQLFWEFVSKIILPWNGGLIGWVGFSTWHVWWDLFEVQWENDLICWAFLSNWMALKPTAITVRQPFQNDQKIVVSDFFTHGPKPLHSISSLSRDKSARAL